MLPPPPTHTYACHPTGSTHCMHAALPHCHHHHRNHLYLPAAPSPALPPATTHPPYLLPAPLPPTSTTCHTYHSTAGRAAHTTLLAGTLPHCMARVSYAVPPAHYQRHAALRARDALRHPYLPAVRHARCMTRGNTCAARNTAAPQQHALPADRADAHARVPAPRLPLRTHLLDAHTRAYSRRHAPCRRARTARRDILPRAPPSAILAPRHIPRLCACRLPAYLPLRACNSACLHSPAAPLLPLP